MPSLIMKTTLKPFPTLSITSSRGAKTAVSIFMTLNTITVSFFFTCLTLTSVAVEVECISVIFPLRDVATCKGLLGSAGSNPLLLVIGDVDWERENVRGAGESVLSKIPSSLSGKALWAIDVRVRKCFLDDLEAGNDIAASSVA